MALAAGDDVIRRLFLLQHQPHRHDVILRAAPVSPALEIAEREFMVEPARDPRHRARDLAGDEILAAPGRLVVIENAIADKDAVRLAVNLRELGRERLRAAVGTRRPEWRRLGLGRFGGAPENLGTGSVIELHRLQMVACDLEHAELANTDLFAGSFRNRETEPQLA